MHSSLAIPTICIVTLLAACSNPSSRDDSADTLGPYATDSADEVGEAGDAEAGTTMGDSTDGETDSGGETDTGEEGPVCGNMVVDAGEDCDDGNSDETDACTNSCLFAECGDGLVQVGVEDCDDGNDDPFDDCTNECTMAQCGDGIVQTGEECDAGEGNNGPGMACKGDCTDNVCGDGDPGPGEGCDDGNAIDDDGCNNMCALASCGDSMTQAPEECDDGNDINEDMCTNVCTLAACGDEFLQAGEECDEGGSNSNNAMCTLSCLIAECGDGNVLAGTEECDDGANNGPGMACNAMCLDNYCGDEDVGPGEECDDGAVNNGPGLACLTNCTLNVCGDGDKGPGEGCDDGNLINGDGCNSNCAPEMVPPMTTWCGNSIYECGDTLDNDNDGLTDLDDPECTTPCDDDESSYQTSLPGQNLDCKQDCFWDDNSGQGDDHCVWNLKCDPENPGEDVNCEYEGPCDPQLPNSCLNFCVPLVPNGCDCFGCCLIGNEYYYLDSNPQCSLDNLAACNNCTFFPDCANECEPENCELCFGQQIEDLPEDCQEPSCDFGSPCQEQSDCPVGEFCQTGCCTPVIPG